MLRYETLHRPAETLDADAAARLRAQILELNLRLSDAPAFAANWHARIDRFFEGMAWIDLAWQGDRLVGHCGTRALPVRRGEGIYVDNCTVDPDLQGRGIGRRLTGRTTARCAVRSALHPVYIALRTQNPVMGAESVAVAGGGRHCFPRYDGGPVTPALAEVAAGAAATLWPELDYEQSTGVLRGAYGGRFLDAQRTRRADAAAYFERHVDRERGDALLVVVRMSPRSWIHAMRYFVGHALRRLSAPLRRRLAPA